MDQNTLMESIAGLEMVLSEQAILLKNITEKLQTHDEMFVELVGKHVENAENSIKVNSGMIQIREQIIDIKTEQIEISKKLPVIFDQISDAFGHIQRLWKFGSQVHNSKK